VQDFSENWLYFRDGTLKFGASLCLTVLLGRIELPKIIEDLVWFNGAYNKTQKSLLASKHQGLFSDLL